jgi:hypothetical protein
MHNHAHIRRNIMRRVWYTYLLSVFARPSTALGFLFGSSVIGLWKLVSLTSIATNVLNVRVGDLPHYIFASLVQAEILALVAFGIIIFTLLTLGVKLPQVAFHSRHTTQSA